MEGREAGVQNLHVRGGGIYKVIIQKEGKPSSNIRNKEKKKLLR